MRARDLDRLADTPYDLLVVGGGIHGLAIAYEAASRGLRTALVEAADFGSGASFNHQKTAHGGLRSLQSGRLDRAREAVRERRALARIAPWLLRPLPFLVGTYRSVTRSRLVLRAAFRVDGWIARDRNAGVEPELHLPPARLISKAATLRLFPGIRQDKLTGGAQWYDYQMVESERLTLAFAAAADRAGADLANYARALLPTRDGGRVTGMTVKDLLTDGDLRVSARAVVNAAGSRAGEVMRAFGVDAPFPLLKAMNLVTTKRASDIALAAPAGSRRMLTLVPWHGRAVVGTSQSAALSHADDTAVTSPEIDAFIAEANAAFPALALTQADVSLVHRGLVPAVTARNRLPDLRPLPEIRDHAGDGAAGAFTAIGVKYTTARALAERVVNRVARSLRKRIDRSRTAITVLPGAGIADHEALAIETARAMGFEVAPPTIHHLTRLYAESAADVIRLMAARPELRRPLGDTAATIGAEIVHVTRSEMAMRLSDVVIRRTGLGAAGQPDAAALRAAARIAADELQWNEQQTSEEIAAVERFYLIV
jgi:glycerol-3-phosphate dehydrogenase